MAIPSAPLSAQAAPEPILYQHADGRYGLSYGPAQFSVGVPEWVRVPIDVIEPAPVDTRVTPVLQGVRDEKDAFEREYQADWYDPSMDTERKHFCLGWHVALAAANATPVAQPAELNCAPIVAAQAQPTDAEEGDVWPIAVVTVDKKGRITRGEVYAPGLPPGTHNLYPVRVPYLDEHTEAWQAVYQALCDVAQQHLDATAGNGIRRAVAAIHSLAAQASGQAQEAVRVLIDHAEGRTPHVGDGLCPDACEGHSTRDPDCPVCRAIDAARQEKGRRE